MWRSFILLLMPLANGAKLLWMPGSNLDVLDSWPEGLLTKCDGLVIGRTNGILRLNKYEDFGLSSLIFSSDVTLNMPDGTGISFAARDDCQGKTISKKTYQPKDIYSSETDKSWANPSHWQSISSWRPHAFRIPCAGDEIVFPDGTIQVDLPGFLVPVGSVTYNNQLFQNGEEWGKFLMSDVGYAHFKSSDSSLRDYLFSGDTWPTDYGCTNKKKCHCFRDMVVMGLYGRPADMSVPEIVDAICLTYLTEAGGCEMEKPKCYQPVTPFGHCCGVCGAILDIKDHTQDGYDIKLIKATVDKQIKGTRLKSFVGRLHTEDIQIAIISDEGDTVRAYQVADAIMAKINSDILGGKTKVGLTLSGIRNDESIVGHAFGLLFGTLFGVLSMIASIYYIYGVLPKQRWLTERRKFMFARFHNNLNEATSEENLVLSTEPTLQPRQQGEAFHNPLYNPDRVHVTQTEETLPSTSKAKSTERSAEREESLLAITKEIGLERSCTSLAEKPVPSLLSAEDSQESDVFSAVENNMISEDLFGVDYDKLLE